MRPEEAVQAGTLHTRTQLLLKQNNYGAGYEQKSSLGFWQCFWFCTGFSFRPVVHYSDDLMTFPVLKQRVIIARLAEIIVDDDDSQILCGGAAES